MVYGLIMKFKDGLGREWVIQFNFHTLCRVEDELGYKIMENPTDLPNNPRAYVEIAWLCVEQQAEKAGVSPSDFGLSLDGQAMDNLIKCICLELAVFFEGPRPGASELLRKSIESQDKLSKVSKEVIAQAFDEMFSDLQGLSVSSPGGTASGN